MQLFDNLSTEEAGLLLLGLRAVHVSDQLTLQRRLERALESRLRKDGLVLADSAQGLRLQKREHASGQ